MKKNLYVIIIAVLAAAAFLTARPKQIVSETPYQESDGELLIPQKNVVIAAADITSIGGLNNASIERLETLQSELISIHGVTGVSSLLNAYIIISDDDEIMSYCQ